MARNSFTAEDAEARRFAEDRIPQRTSSPQRPLRESAVQSFRAAGAVLVTGIILFAISILAAPRVSAQMPAPGEQRTSHSGVYTAEQAERGRMTYALSCRSCHTAASHTGVTFAKWWKDRTVADLYGYMSTQMPKNDPGSLNPEQYAEVVAYLLKMNAMPAGTTELLADSSVLAQIRIELPKASASTPTRKAQAKSPTRTKGP
jgi:mono/diheme cytochrome c family protein